MASGRAKVGGEIGMNGQFYAGGTFLPSTTMGKMMQGNKARSGSGKVEIEPYVWQVAPEGKKSLWRHLVGIVAVWDRQASKLVLRQDDGLENSLQYLGTTRQRSVELIERFNAGERWIDANESV